MADDRSFARLQEEHFKALQQSRERIEKWERFQADYEALQARLYTLPDKLTHDIMVPFGRFGFIPGRMYHTNEVMVLLGDNWFAKRTAKQALEIAERRKQYVMKMLEDERQQMADWQARLGFTEQMRASRQEHEGVIEIKEELKSEEEAEASAEKHWKARQPKHQVPPPRPAFTKGLSKTLGPKEPVSGSAEDQALWDRLDELEREEEGNGEQEDDESIYKEDVEKEGVAEQKLEVERRRPLLKHDVLERPATESSGVFPDEEMRATGSAPFHITVRHSHSGNDQLSETNKVRNVTDDGKGSSDTPLFMSPGDIFKQHDGLQRSNVTQRSREVVEPEGCVQWEEEEKESRDVGEEKCVKWAPVLESHQSLEPVGGEEEEEKMPMDEAPHTQVAFSGQVVERFAPPSDATSSLTDEASKAPKVSKFKASRKRS